MLATFTCKVFTCSKAIGSCIYIIKRDQILINNGIFLYMQMQSALSCMLYFCVHLSKTSYMGLFWWGGLLWVVGSDLEGQLGRYLGQNGWSNKPHIVALLSARGPAFVEECCACILIVIFYFGNTLTWGSTNLAHPHIWHVFVKLWKQQYDKTQMFNK